MEQLHPQGWHVGLAEVELLAESQAAGEPEDIEAMKVRT
jgi:hypothetical protein